MPLAKATRRAARRWAGKNRLFRRHRHHRRIQTPAARQFGADQSPRLPFLPHRRRGDTPTGGFPISALKSGCRLPQAGTANTSRKVSGGSSGSIGTGSMLEPLEAGYATLATDNGHISRSRCAQWRQRKPLGGGGIRRRWSISPGARCMSSSVAAKGRDRKFLWQESLGSLFSSAVRPADARALMEATRFSGGFRRHRRGARPAWRWSSQMGRRDLEHLARHQGSQRVDRFRAPVFSTRRRSKACDTRDGVEDGVISDPRPLRFSIPNRFNARRGRHQRMPDARYRWMPRRASMTARTAPTAARIFPGYTRGSRATLGPGCGPENIPADRAGIFWRYGRVAETQTCRAPISIFDKDADKMINGQLLGSSMTDNYKRQNPTSPRFQKRGRKS